MKTCRCQWHLYLEGAQPSGPPCARALRELLTACVMSPLSRWELRRAQEAQKRQLTTGMIVEAQVAYARKQARYRASGS